MSFTTLPVMLTILCCVEMFEISVRWSDVEGGINSSGIVGFSSILVASSQINNSLVF